MRLHLGKSTRHRGYRIGAVLSDVSNIVGKFMEAAGTTKLLLPYVENKERKLVACGHCQSPLSVAQFTMRATHRGRICAASGRFMAAGVNSRRPSTENAGMGCRSLEVCNCVLGEDPFGGGLVYQRTAQVNTLSRIADILPEEL